MNAQISPSREPLPVLQLVLPRCPGCGSTRLLAQQTIDIGSGTKIRKARCAQCGDRALIEVSYAKETDQNLVRENPDLDTFPADAS